MSLYEALRRRFKAPEYGILFEVANATGGRARRRADAIVMGLWPSRGLLLEGIEIKTERSDWLREKKDPEKAEVIAGYCDRWWLATTKGVANLDEIPAGWGWLEMKGKSLVQRKEAPISPPDKPIDRLFLAALMRGMSTVQGAWIPKSDIADEIALARDEAHENAKQSAEYRVAEWKRKADDLTRKIERFEEAAGIKIDRYDPTPIGAAVKLVLAGDARRNAVELEDSLMRIQGVARRIEVALAEYREAHAVRCPHCDKPLPLRDTQRHSHRIVCGACSAILKVPTSNTVVLVSAPIQHYQSDNLDHNES